MLLTTPWTPVRTHALILAMPETRLRLFALKKKKPMPGHARPILKREESPLVVYMYVYVREYAVVVWRLSAQLRKPVVRWSNPI